MKKLLLPFFISLHLFASGQKVWYVFQAVNGGLQNGNSWNDAFPDLQQALTVASPGDQIWVAYGTYFPTQQFDRSISFVMKPGVALYGGFLGFEAQLSDRELDWEFLPTTLSGNIGNVQSLEDNSYHVLKAEGLDSTAILDGFIVVYGHAFGGLENDHGGGMLILPSQVYENTNPKIENCFFAENRAMYGGAISCNRIPNQDYHINPILRNCLFISNKSTFDGGAVYKNGPALPGSPFEVRGCYFARNRTTHGQGGGVYIGNGAYDNLFFNCTFEQDTASTGLGGGIYVASGNEFYHGITLNFEQCTFNRNEALEGGGIMYHDLGNPAVFLPVLNSRIKNCYFYKNVNRNGTGAAYNYYGFSKITMNLEVTNTEFLENRTTGNVISSIGGGSDSKCNLKISGCKYLKNTNLYDSTWSAYPVTLGVGGSRGQFDALIENTLFNRNGGGIHSAGSSGGCKIKILINNCTFFNNSKNTIINKSYYDNFNGVDEYIETWINNCVITEFVPSIYTLFGDNNAAFQTVEGYHINNTIVSLGEGWFTTLPEVFGPNMISSFNPQFTSVASSDYSLLPCSPGVDAGDNLVPDTTGLVFDLAGNPRIFHGRVDMGAYETQDSCPTSLVVQPIEQLPTIQIQPNPASSCTNIQVKILSATTGTIRWMLRDQSGRLTTRGSSEQAEFIIPAPKSPGIYTLMLKVGKQAVYEKLVVTD